MPSVIMLGAVGLRFAAPSFDWLDTGWSETLTFVTIKSFFGKTVSHFSNAQTSAALGLGPML
jgi:hypothetical protein